MPVAPQEARATVGPLCDNYICLREPKPFEAVRLWFDQFEQVEDAAVVAALA